MYEVSKILSVNEKYILNILNADTLPLYFENNNMMNPCPTKICIKCAQKK